jgi:hypothetical protein
MDICFFVKKKIYIYFLCLLFSSVAADMCWIDWVISCVPIARWTSIFLACRMQTWQFLYFLFNKYIKFKNWTFWNQTFCKPDVLKPDVLKPDVLKPDVLKPDVLKPDVLWVYRIKQFNENLKSCLLLSYRDINLNMHFLFSEFLDLTLADKVDLRSSAAGNTVPSANQADLKNSSMLIFSQKLYRKT